MRVWKQNISTHAAIDSVRAKRLSWGRLFRILTLKQYGADVKLKFGKEMNVTPAGRPRCPASPDTLLRSSIPDTWGESLKNYQEWRNTTSTRSLKSVDAEYHLPHTEIQCRALVRY